VAICHRTIRLVARSRRVVSIVNMSITSQPWRGGVPLNPRTTLSDLIARVFSAPFAKVFNSPIASPGAVAAIPWYLSGGIVAANCVVAYDAKNAASQAASYINLNNPGTNDAVVGSAPTWAAGSGWTFDGIAQYLYVPIQAASHWSYYIRCSPDYTQAGPNKNLFGIMTSNFEIVGIRFDNGNGLWVWYHNDIKIITGRTAANAVWAIVDTKGYENTTQVATGMLGTLSGTIVSRFGISARIEPFNIPTLFKSQTVNQFAIFNIDTASSHAALVTAILAL